ncbi:MAG: hypothetical protein RI953_144 [Pseudomonadota bacterium]
MFKTSILSIMCLHLMACTTSKYEMLADGRTWLITRRGPGCGLFDSEQSCKGSYADSIHADAIELCGKEPERFFQCARQSHWDFYYYGCFAACKSVHGQQDASAESVKNEDSSQKPHQKLYERLRKSK